jgi:adenylate cyclase
MAMAITPSLNVSNRFVSIAAGTIRNPADACFDDAMKCPSCGFDNPEGFVFCGSCGATLGRACPSCGAENPEGFRFCGTCGRPLEGSLPAPAVPSERRPVAVLFADLVGFSTIAEHLDPEELRTLMTETFADLTAEVETREGTVEKFIGDAVMAVFGAPQAHEDDPVRAVDAAVAMLEAVRRRSERTPTPLQLRIGINSGLVVSGTVGDGTQTGVMGDAVNVAARLQQTAGPGEILVADPVWRRVRDRYEVRSVGPLDVKGRERPIEAYRVVGSREPSPRRQAPFVGRRDEIALLELLWSSVQKVNTHVVSVVGEPGVGKSRLLGELPHRDGGLDTRITCGPERALGPFLDLVEAILGGTPTGIEELRRRAGELGADEETVALLAAFLGFGDAPAVTHMADEQQKRQVFAGVWQFLVAALGEDPGLIVLDDIHWADQSSLDLLAFLLERLAGVPLLLVLAYRPGFQQVERAALRASHTGIRLEPMSPEESVELARGYLGVDLLPDDLEKLVATRAEGNPFFIEELLQALLELGSLAVLDGKAVLAKVEVEIPDTVQGTILARLDRLRAGERSTLQQAAVLGRAFTSDLLAAVAGDQSVDALDGLARAQLVVPQGPGRWAFKHALIQEVTYETLLHRQRAELHRRVAEALEARARDDPASLELLAEHYARAEAPAKAREYAVRAGDLATQRMGFVDAYQRYETAFRLWGQGDEEGRLALLMKLGRAAMVAGEAARARTALLEAESGWRAVGRTREAGAALATLGRVYWMTGEAERAADAFHGAIEALEPAGPSPELVQAFVWGSTLTMLKGQNDESSALATRGLGMAEELGLDGARSHLLNNLGVCDIHLGAPSGVERLRQALALAERSGDPEAIGRAYTNLPEVLEELGDARESVELCRRGRELMRQRGSPAFEWFIAGNEARALAGLGRYDEAEALATETLGHERAMRTPPGIVNAAMSLMMALLRRGRLGEAAEIRDEALPLARRVGGADFLGRTLAVEAELEEARGNLAAARQVAEEGLEIAFAVPSVSHWLTALPVAVRLLPRDRVESLLPRVRQHVRHPAHQVALAAAEAALAGDRRAFSGPAAMYRDMERPYEEAACRLEAGELDRARELIDRYGLGEGPLGARLRKLEAEPAQ